MRPWLAFAEQKLDEIVALTRASTRARTPSPPSSPPIAPTRRSPRATSPLRRNPRRAASGWPRSPPDADRARAALRRARRATAAAPATAAAADDDHRLLPADRRAARRPHGRFDTGEIDGRGVRGVPRRPDPPRSSPGRRRSGSTCWSTASPSATTWSSTSASSSTASPSPTTAGCRATARATCGRRSSSATSPGPHPMTVRWATFAQSLTERPVKGMLTGPVTILNWSFVRDDQPRGRDLPPDRPRHPRRGRRPRRRRDRRDPDRRAGAARGAAAAPRRSGGLSATGRWPASGWPPPARGRRPRSTPTCATASSATSSTRSPRSTPTCFSIENARSDQELLEVFRTRATTRGSVPASTTSTRPRVPDAAELIDRLREPLDRARARPRLGQPRLRAQDAQAGRGLAGAGAHGGGGAGGAK